jgi:hypothetical protein
MHRGSILAIALLGLCLATRGHGQERFERTDHLDMASVRSEKPATAPSLPDEIDVDDGHPDAPAGYHREERNRPGRAALGSVLFGGAWLPAAYLGVAGLSCQGDVDRCSMIRRLQPGVLPVIGPLIAAPEFCKDNATCLGIFVTDAVLQGLGAYLLISGVMKREVYVLDRTSEHRRSSIAVSATPTPTGALLSVTGAF